MTDRDRFTCALELFATLRSDIRSDEEACITEALLDEMIDLVLPRCTCCPPGDPDEGDPKADDPLAAAARIAALARERAESPVPTIH